MGATVDQEEFAERLADVRRLLALAIVSWPPFVVLDLFGIRLWNGGHEAYGALSLRIAITGLLVIDYLAVRYVKLSPLSLDVLDVATNVVIGTAVSLIGLVFHGGLRTHDFAGIILVFVMREITYPSHWKRALPFAAAVVLTWPVTAVVASWYVPMLRVQWASPLGPSEFAYGMVFIVFSLAMGTAASHTIWITRREVRTKSRELAENRAELATKVSQLESTNVELRRLNDELAVSNHRADRIFTALADALPGKVLDGKYQLRERIGSGGFGVVFSATHLVMRRMVAVKVFRPTPGNDSAEALERFRREAISTCLVQHPNAVAVYDSGISGENIPYLAMELLDGEPLSALLARGGTLDLARCLSIAVPVCDALQVAHDQGIVHRDVKPENVFLHESGAGQVVKVVDFGIAGLLHVADAATVANKLTATNVIVGTPAYVAPERVTGDRYDGRADVYSVGVLVYEMLTGHLPIEHGPQAIGLAAFIKQATQAARPMSDWLPGVPDEVEALVMRALARDPALRPTAGELRDELRHLERRSIHARFAKAVPAS